MLEGLKRFTNSIINTVTGAPAEAQKPVEQGEGAMPKAKSGTTTTTTTTVTPLDQRAAATLSSAKLPLDVIFNILENTPAENKAKQILKFRELNTTFRDMIDVGSVADKVLIKITTEDLTMGGKTLLEKLKFAEKNNLPLSLDIDIDINTPNILAEFFSVAPEAAAAISHISFGEIGEINADTGNVLTAESIFNFLAENQNKLPKLSSMHIAGIQVGEGRNMNLPDIASLTSLSIGRLDGQVISNLANLNDLHIDVLSIPYPHTLYIGAKNISINTLESALEISSNPNLQKLVINSANIRSNIFLGFNLPALEEVEVFTHKSAPIHAGGSAELDILDSLPNLKRLLILFYPGEFYARSASDFPALEEISYPERLKDLPLIQAIEKDIEQRKSQRGDFDVEMP